MHSPILASKGQYNLTTTPLLGQETTKLTSGSNTWSSTARSSTDSHDAKTHNDDWGHRPQ